MNVVQATYLELVDSHRVWQTAGSVYELAAAVVLLDVK